MLFTFYQTISVWSDSTDSFNYHKNPVKYYLSSISQIKKLQHSWVKNLPKITQIMSLLCLIFLDVFPGVWYKTKSKLLSKSLHNLNLMSCNVFPAHQSLQVQPHGPSPQSLNTLSPLSPISACLKPTPWPVAHSFLVQLLPILSDSVQTSLPQ